jgi:hypothetical protein
MTTRRLFVALFALALVVMAVRETLDPDMWWHLRTGEVIVERGLPRQDIFSFTVPDHEWITHEWLSQVVMWLAYQAAGLPGLSLLFGGLTALAFWLVYRACPGRPYLAPFVVLLAAIASALVWGARPQTFNILLAAAFVYLVEGVRARRLGGRWLWLLPPLTILWANLHSGYLFGVALILAYVAGDALSLVTGTRPTAGLNWSAVRRLLAMAGASLLAALANPSGYRLWIYPFPTLGSGAMQDYILEWQSPDFHQAIFWPFAVLVALGVAAWLAAPGRPTWSDLILFGGTAAAGFLSARHVPLFAVVAPPIVCRALVAALAERRLVASLLAPAQTPAPGRLALVNGALLLLALLAAAGLIITRLGNNEAAIARFYPVAAVDYLDASGLADERGYNSYNWGGYLIWRGVPVFVDGRADVYGDDFLHYYRRTFDMTDQWRGPLDEFAIRYVIMEAASPLNTLLATAGWQRVYADDVAHVYRRDQ